MISKSSHKKGDWQRCAEGFDGVVKSAARKLQYSSGQLQQQADSQIEDIEWNSSEEEVDNDQQIPTDFVEHSSPKPNVSIVRTRKPSASISYTNARKRHTSVSPTFPSQIARKQNKVSLYDDDGDVDIVEFSQQSGLSSREVANISPQSEELGFNSEQSSGEISDDLISDCVSEAKETVPVDVTQDEVAVISSLDTPSQSPDRTVVKGTDWIRQIVTPVKPSNQDTPVQLEDSAKKKKKFEKGGLAEQLQKVMSREKSAHTFWKHQWLSNTKADIKQRSGSRVVLVSSVSSECSHYKCQCTYMDSTDCNPPGDQCKNCTVLIAKSTGITPITGECITIHPPWQRLGLKDDEVLFCNYVSKSQTTLQLVKSEIFTPEEDCKTTPKTMWRTIARWHCQCMEDSGIMPRDCSSYPPVCSAIVEYDHRDIACTQSSSISHLTTHVLPPVVHESILDSLEGAQSTVNGVSFQAAVQRVLCKRLPNGGTRWTLLVEDKFGCFCHVHLPEKCDTLESWSHVVKQGEGLVYTFQGLEVETRTTRERCPVLFSLIDTIWNPDSVAKRADSQTSIDNSCPSNEVSPPGFCYELTASTRGGSCEQSIHTLPVVCELHTCTVYDLLTKDGEAHRWSCYALVILAKSSYQDNPCVLYITDNSLQVNRSCDRSRRPYATILVQPSVCMPSDPRMLLCKDILCQSGSLVADSYSRFIPASCPQTIQQLSEIDITTALPYLTHNVEEKSLVTFSCTVESVDEDTAFSWLVCGQCSLELDQSSGGPQQIVLFCHRCNKEVSSPVTRMSMEVFSSCPDVSGNVKIKLLQKTIQELLPAELQEEGCDVDVVIGKQIGPMACLVLRTENCDRTGGTFTLEEIERPGVT